MILQKGVYYIGDLCYVMHNEWDELCQLLEGDQYPNEGYQTEDSLLCLTLLMVMVNTMISKVALTVWTLVV
jgi:hypothetical protein